MENNFIQPPKLSTSFSETGKSAKQRFDNILNTKTKKTGILVFISIVLITFIAGTLIACTNNAAIDDIVLSSPPNAPEWLGNLLEFGTYKEKIQVGNNSDILEVSDKIKIPKSNLISILLETPINDIHLYEDSISDLKEFINIIQQLDVTLISEETAVSNILSTSLISQTNIILSNSNYTAIDIRSYNDGTHIFAVKQNDSNLYCQSESSQLSNLIRQITDLKTLSYEDIQSIIKLDLYTSNDGHIEFNEKELNTFINGIQNSNQIQNLSTGCPFNNKIKATLQNGTVLNMKYSSDGCGILIVEDTTYELSEKYENKFNDIFYLKY